MRNRKYCCYKTKKASEGIVSNLLFDILNANPINFQRHYSLGLAVFDLGFLHFANNLVDLLLSVAEGSLQLPELGLSCVDLILQF